MDVFSMSSLHKRLPKALRHSYIADRQHKLSFMTLLLSHSDRVQRPCVLLGVLSLIFILRASPVEAQHAEAFDLYDGDRIVFVGDGLIEHAQDFGYIEQALTTRRPARRLTFRNVGWSGDTVWGEARDHYTNPPTPYEHLLEQITTPQPTVVVLGYGGTLAYDDAEAIPPFMEGYHQLLDSLTTLNVRCVMLSPLPHDAKHSPYPEGARLNQQLQQTRNALEAVAQERGCAFVDLFTPMARRFQESTIPLTANGIHLNAKGYQAVATLIDQRLAGSPRLTALRLDLSSGSVEGGRLHGEIEQEQEGYQFILMPDVLPEVGQRRKVSVTGLSRGQYTLWANGEALHTASARAWKEGVVVAHPAEQVQTEKLRQVILEKNALYFRQYRPQNETYLVGFRRYEQGQNAAELEQLTPLIHEKENEIGRLRRPHPLAFTLTKE